MNPGEEKTLSPPVEGFRLSPQQQRLWATQAEQDGPFRVQATISIQGRLDAQVLKDAIAHVVERHEILRTTFSHLAGSQLPGQVVHEVLAPVFQSHDLGGQSDSKQNAEVETLFQEVAHRPFDFERGPLLQLSLLRLSADSALLLVGLPALCADAVALANLVREISRSYAACLRNEELSGAVMQYADIAEWQNEFLESEDGKTGRAFWKGQEVAKGFGLELPFGQQPAGTDDFKPQVFSSEWDRGTVRRIQLLAQKCEISTATFLLTCWQILLWRLAGQKELVIGVAHDGREFEELEEVLGLFEKHLPFCGRLEASSRFDRLAAQTQDSLKEIYKWQQSFSWQQITESTGKSTQTPFFPVCFAFEEQGARSSAGEVSFAIQRQVVCVERFDLKLVGIQRREGLEVAFHYDANRFQESELQRLAGQFRVVMEGVVDRPEAIVGELPILGDDEYRRLVFEFNDTQAAYPKDICIHHLIEGQAQRTPEAIAVEFEDQRLSYAALDARANQLARHLQTLGVGPNVLVAICVSRSLEMVVGILGILKAGGVYVPLDPTYPRERLNFILEDTGAQVLLTQQRIGAELFEQQTAAGQDRTVLYLDTDWQDVAKGSVQPPATGARPHDLAYVIYTSGSTGTPKGVIVTHQNLVCSDSARAAYYTEPVNKFLLLSSVAFDSSIVGIFWTLTQGGTLLLISEDSQKDPNRLAEQIAEHHVSHLLTLPSFYGLILAQVKSSSFDGLRTVIVAGEPCPKTLVDRHKEVLADTALFSEYGATETTVFSSVYNCLAQRLNIAPIGEPIANAQMFLLNPSLQPVPIGVLGEVYFGGDGLAQGYLNRPELTAERFIPNPFSKEPGARLYQSGDLARHRPDGDIEFIGRTDEQVKIRGYRIELGEVEATCAQHPAVLEVVVVAKSIGELPADPDTQNGEGTGPTEAIVADAKRLVAYVVATQGQTPTINELRRFLAEKMPDFMVPSVFVFLAALPRTPNGKVDRRALPAPSSARPELEQTFVAPQTAVEKVLAEIWAQALGLERVGAHDNFFELGGDSILSIQIVSRANQAGLGFTPRQIFEHQSVAQLAQVAGTSRAITAEQGEVEGRAPLIPVQHWFFALDAPNPHHWNISLMLEVHHALSPAVLERAGRQLLVHHDALRLRFSSGSGWQQTTAPVDEAVPVDRVDLSALEGASQQAALKQKASEFQARVNFEKGPLMRFVLFELGAHQPVRLLWILHHLVGDVVSWRILVEDLQTAVQQLGRGEAIGLPAKTTSFKLWAERLTQHAQSGALEGELGYWLAEPRARVPGLPVDFAQAQDANTFASERTVNVELSPEETRGLLQEVPAAYNTQINDVLLTALVQSFSQWTGTRSLLIDLEGHGREEIFADVDLSRTVGWFTTSFPVMLSLGEADDSIEALRSIKEQLRSVPNNGIGYGLLRHLSGVAEIVEPLCALPQPEINFNYLGQLDQIQRGSSLFGLAGESTGAERDPQGGRPHLLEIVGSVVGGCLQVEWLYSEIGRASCRERV